MRKLLCLLLLSASAACTSGPADERPDAGPDAQEPISWYECQEGDPARPGTNIPWLCGCVVSGECPERIERLLGCGSCVETTCDYGRIDECAPPCDDAR
jgi:hypothetical protein